MWKIQPQLNGIFSGIISGNIYETRELLLLIIVDNMDLRPDYYMDLIISLSKKYVEGGLSSYFDLKGVLTFLLFLQQIGASWGQLIG